MVNLGGNGEAPVLSGKKSQAEKCADYFKRRILNPTETKKESAVAAGYSPNTTPTNIEKSALAGSIRAEIAAACSTHKATPDDCIRVAAGVMNDKEENGGTKLKAIERISKMAGYEAPVKAEVKETKEEISMFMSLFRQENVSISTLISSANNEKKALLDSDNE